MFGVSFKHTIVCAASRCNARAFPFSGGGFHSGISTHIYIVLPDATPRVLGLGGFLQAHAVPLAICKTAFILTTRGISNMAETMHLPLDKVANVGVRTYHMILAAPMINAVNPRALIIAWKEVVHACS